MSDLTLENTREFEELDKVLSDSIDKELLSNLDHYLDIVRKNSRALASSLKRCFDNARKSKRYLLVYELGIKDPLKCPTYVKITPVIKEKRFQFL